MKALIDVLIAGFTVVNYSIYCDKHAPLLNKQHLLEWQWKRAVMSHLACQLSCEQLVLTSNQHSKTMKKEVDYKGYLWRNYRGHYLLSKR